jgi:uncharacterized protein
MLTSAIERTVLFCTRYARLVMLAALIVATVSGVYATRHFAITTDVTRLIAATNSAWFKNQLAYQAEFPTQAEFPAHKVLVVVDAATPEQADQAADKLTQSIAARSSVIQSAAQLGGGPFFERNALLFLQEQEVAAVTSGLSRSAPLLRVLASDPSLRGIARVLSFVASGVQNKQIQLTDLARPLTLGADTLSDVLAGRPASFSWRVLVQGQTASPEQLRRFITVDPRLDFSALEPGRAATDAIRQSAAELKLASDFGARVRLTGQVAINDEEFGTLSESAPVTVAETSITVLIILFLALRSWRIIAPVVFALIVGFCATAAIGLLVVGKLNLISIAFAVLFIGLGVDFGLQFSVRYRSERHNINDLRVALGDAARKAGVPLALAAAATTCAFFSFLPTAFRGLSELGEIAGLGMLIAFSRPLPFFQPRYGFRSLPPSRCKWDLRDSLQLIGSRWRIAFRY